MPGALTENPTVPTIFETCDYDGTCTEYTVNTPVTLKNPCIDSNFVRVIPPQEFTREDYVVAGGAETFTAHGDFIVSTTPVTHDLCGTLTKTPLYQPVTNGEFVDLDGSVVVYDDNNQ